MRLHKRYQPMLSVQIGANREFELLGMTEEAPSAAILERLKACCALIEALGHKAGHTTIFPASLLLDHKSACAEGSIQYTEMVPLRDWRELLCLVFTSLYCQFCPCSVHKILPSAAWYDLLACQWLSPLEILGVIGTLRLGHATVC